MTKIMDEIVLQPRAIKKVLQLFGDEYSPGAERRGLKLLSQWLSPPVELSDSPNTLWLLWELPDDPWAFWGMRTAQGPEVVAFWAAVDGLSLSRKRHVVVDAESPLVAPIPSHEKNHDKSHEKDLRNAFETGQITLEETADRQRFEQIISDRLASETKLQYRLSENLEGSVGAGDYTFDARGEYSRSTMTSLAFLKAIEGVSDVDVVQYQRLASAVRDKSLRNGIWRTLMLRVRPEAKLEDVQAWMQANLKMPDYMAGIRNWSFGQVTSASRWTHVWQQEFQAVDDLLGEYMLNPYHWGCVDHWFDPEFPDCVVDVQLCHAFCPFETSYLSLTEVHHE